MFVSIIVITYNSDDYVFQTLESIKNQSCKNFEVLVCDDGSSDKTVKICETWSLENQNVSVRILADGVNRGIPGNCNKGIIASKGTWIKLIAGDDLLHKDCLLKLKEEYEKTNLSLYVGKFKTFKTVANKNKYLSTFPQNKDLSFFQKSAEQQLQRLLTDSFNFAPAVFIAKSLFEKYGLFDERFKLLEDLPYWIKLTENGIKFNLIDDLVVYYRTQHESTVFAGEKFYNVRFMKGLFEFRKEVVYKKVPKSNLIFYQAEFMERLNFWVITKIFRNKKNKLSKVVGKIILFPTFKRLLSINRTKNN